MTPYQYQVFFNKGSGGQRGDEHHGFSNASHVSGLIHKTAAGIPVLSVTRHNYGEG